MVLNTNTEVSHNKVAEEVKNVASSVTLLTELKRQHFIPLQ